LLARRGAWRNIGMRPATQHQNNPTKASEAGFIRKHETYGNRGVRIGPSGQSIASIGTKAGNHGPGETERRMAPHCHR